MRIGYRCNTNKYFVLTQKYISTKIYQEKWHIKNSLKKVMLYKWNCS